MKQQRKKYSGEKNDRERTMGRLVDSVGKVLGERGYTGLTVSNISRCAGVDRKLVSVYFGTVEKLIGTYIRGRDYWFTGPLSAMEPFGCTPKDGPRPVMESLLLDHLNHL